MLRRGRPDLPMGSGPRDPGGRRGTLMQPLSTPVPAKARGIEADVKGAGGREVFLFPSPRSLGTVKWIIDPVLVKNKNWTRLTAAPYPHLSPRQSSAPTRLSPQAAWLLASTSCPICPLLSRPRPSLTTVDSAGETPSTRPRQRPNLHWPGTPPSLATATQQYSS